MKNVGLVFSDRDHWNLTLKMGKKDKSKKGKGAEKTIAKTLKKQSNKLKKELAAKGEV